MGRPWGRWRGPGSLRRRAPGQRSATQRHPHLPLPHTPLPCPAQVFRDLRPGLGVSRLGDREFVQYLQLAAYCTQYLRLKEVLPVGLSLCFCAAQHASLASRYAGNLRALPRCPDLALPRPARTPMVPAAPSTARDRAPCPGPAAGTARCTLGSQPACLRHPLLPLQERALCERTGRQEAAAGAGTKAAPEGGAQVSPFACVSATLAWENFHWVSLFGHWQEFSRRGGCSATRAPGPAAAAPVAAAALRCACPPWPSPQPPAPS